MLKSRKVKLILSSILVFIFVFLSIVYVIVRKNGQNIKGLSDSKVEISLDEDRVPYIYSLAPVGVVAGEEYVYVPRFGDSDNQLSELRLSLIEAPSWLFLENGVVTGFAPVDSGSKTYKFVIRISDGYNSSDQENYIVVLENE